MKNKDDDSETDRKIVTSDIYVLDLIKPVSCELLFNLFVSDVQMAHLCYHPSRSRMAETNTQRKPFRWMK